MNRLPINAWVLLLVALAASPAATATPLYRVVGGQQGLHCPDPAQPGTVESATPGVTIDTGASGRSWYAQSNQHSLHVRSVASSNQTLCPVSTASFRISDLYFAHPTLDAIDVSLAVHYDGTLYTSIPSADGTAIATVKNEVRLGNVRGTNVSGFGSSDKLWQSVCTRSGCDGSMTIDEVLVHTWAAVPTNTLLTFEFAILADAFIRRNFGVAGTAIVDFRDTAGFADPSAVFGVPGGTQVSSTQLGLAGNSIAGPAAGVPAPPVLSLLALALPGLALVRRRSRVHTA